MDNSLGILSMPGTGFFGMLIIGVLAGWLAERALNRNHSLLTNMLVGIAGSFVGGTFAGILGVQFYGFVGNLAVATVGAIVILWFFGRREAAHQPTRAGDSTWPHGNGPQDSGPQSSGTQSSGTQSSGTQANTPMYHGKDDGETPR